MELVDNKEFVSLIHKEAVKAVAEYESLISERQDVLREMVKVGREIETLNGIIKYHSR